MLCGNDVMAFCPLWGAADDLYLWILKGWPRLYSQVSLTFGICLVLFKSYSTLFLAVISASGTFLEGVDFRGYDSLLVVWNSSFLRYCTHFEPLSIKFRQGIISYIERNAPAHEQEKSREGKETNELAFSRILGGKWGWMIITNYF